MSIENEFLEIRSMFDIDDDIVSEMAVTNEDIFNLIGDYSHNKNASKEKMFTSELTDSISVTPRGIEAPATAAP